MKLQIPSYLLALLCTLQLITACKKDSNPTPIQVGLVTGIGSLDDKGFNLQAYEGMLTAATAVPVDWEVKVNSSALDIQNNIAYFVSKKVDLIITLGYDAALPTLDAANANPSIRFLLLDYSFASLPANMACVVYSVDEASFPCGFLAAYWARVKNAAKPAVAYVAGPDIPTIRQFTSSFTSGVAYFNSKYGSDVTVSGAFADSFSDTLQGSRMADSLMQLGAEVVFACAGKTGNGALYKVKEANKAGIGVDTDQFASIPEVGGNLLTSCMKKLNEAVITEIEAASKGQFPGGKTLVYNLKNKGVDLAPYHNFDSQIPDSIKQAIVNIKEGISLGTIKTGWQ